MPSFTITPIGQVHSPLRELSEAPRQGWEGAPNAHLEILPAFVEALDGVKAGEEIWVFTWLHQAERSVLKVHPRNDVRNPIQACLQLVAMPPRETVNGFQFSVVGFQFARTPAF